MGEVCISEVGEACVIMIKEDVGLTDIRRIKLEEGRRSKE